MVSGPEDEFANFLEFGDLQLTFPYDGGHQDGRELQQEPGGGMDTSMENGAGPVRLENGPAQRHMDQCSTMAAMNGYHTSTEPFHDLNISGELFNQQPQSHLHLHGPQYSGQNVIPPTPNSIEMHGEQARYYQSSRDHHSQAIYDRLSRNQKDQVRMFQHDLVSFRLIPSQMIFTPLVSPAVTPLDNQFQYPEYAVPGEYFSPLTSPALEAQKHAHQRSIYGAVPRSDTSETTSPIDMNIDFSAPVPMPAASVRKSKRRTTSTSKAANRTVRQSPSMKPQSRKKQPGSTAIPAKEVSGVIEDALSSKALSTKRSVNGVNLGLLHSQESSETGSISPEPLSEILMPPPATPRSSSSSRSPYLLAKQPGPISASIDAGNGEPATPASLMKIRKEAANGTGGESQISNLHGQASKGTETEHVMEDIVLPAPANATTKPVLPPINTSNTQNDLAGSTVFTRKDSRNAHFSAPSTAKKPFFTSPQIHGMTSPVSSISRRGEVKGAGRESKKRNSIASNNSVHVSPALRPKVSPSIKPLLPECGKSSGLSTFQDYVADSYQSDCQRGNISVASRIQIELPKYPGRDPPSWCFLPGSALYQSDVQTYITQNCRTR